MAPMGERRPRGDGLAIAEHMGPDTTDASVDIHHRHVLQQFKRGRDSTPRGNTRSSTANPQIYVAPTHGASEAAADRKGIKRLAAANSAWVVVPTAAATGGDIDMSWELNEDDIEPTVTAMEELLQRIAAASSTQ